REGGPRVLAAAGVRAVRELGSRPGRLLAQRVLAAIPRRLEGAARPRGEWVGDPGRERRPRPGRGLGRAITRRQHRPAQRDRRRVDLEGLLGVAARVGMSFADGRLAAVAGLIDETNYFDLNTYANTAYGQMLNDGFVNSDVFPMPENNLGFNVSWQPS